MKKILKLFSGLLLVLGLAACSNDFTIAEKLLKDNHTHTFATEWTSDATHHWHSATCEHTEEVEDKAEHTFGEWTITTPATEAAEGSKERECSDCGYKATEVIAKLDHVHTFATELISDATHHWYAATCEHTEEVKDKAEHTFDEWTITTPATEDAEGAREKICSVCEYKVEDVIAKLDHVHAKGTFHDAVAGTCLKKATVAYYDCKKAGCEIKLDADGNPLATIEGDFGPHVLGTKHDAVPGTCKTKATLEYYDCTTENCTEKLDKDLNVLASTEGALDPENHESEETKFEAVDAATHKELHKCCNAVKTASLPHNWDSGLVTLNPTVEAEGEKTFTCDDCGQTKTEPVDKVIPFSYYDSPIDAETGLAATASSTYIYFGIFPKTVLPEGSSVTVDENDSIEMGANTYYKGSDGSYYAKVQENCNPSSNVKTYSDESTVKESSENSTRYFKVEPIMWKVLTTDYNGSNKALLLAEDVLTANVPYYGRGNRGYCLRQDNGTAIFECNYLYSQIRAYLNGLDYLYDETTENTVTKTEYNGKGFLQTAFTADARDLIEETEVDNSPESASVASLYYNQQKEKSCENTNDKIFLLSVSEVDNTYGFPGMSDFANQYNDYKNARIKFLTDYAKANYAFQYGGDFGLAARWWLRTPQYSHAGQARRVDYDGTATGNSYSTVETMDVGVVPAITISLQ